MEESLLKACLNIVVQAERDIDQAKEDYKATTDSAFETYECTPDQIKAIRKVARALLKDKVNGIDEETAALVEVIEAVKR